MKGVLVVLCVGRFLALLQLLVLRRKSVEMVLEHFDLIGVHLNVFFLNASSLTLVLEIFKLLLKVLNFLIPFLNDLNFFLMFRIILKNYTLELFVRKLIHCMYTKLQRSSRWGWLRISLLRSRLIISFVHFFLHVLQLLFHLILPSGKLFVHF